jgi:hypothetical protein
VIGSKAERVARKGRSFSCGFGQRERLGGPKTQESMSFLMLRESNAMGEALFRWDKTAEAQAMRLKCKSGTMAWERSLVHLEGKKL